MKTNQIMIREQGFIQRTDDSYFNATALINEWNERNKDKKALGNYMQNDSSKEFIEQLKKEGIEQPIKTKKGGDHKNAGTWVHPKVFIDIAMWVSVEFKSKVIDYVLDGLIKSRHDAGDYYNQMTAVIMETYLDYYGCKPKPMIYIEEANFLKSLVNSKNRNNMTEEELKQLTYLQKFNTMLLKKKLGKEARRKRLIEASEVLI